MGTGVGMADEGACLATDLRADCVRLLTQVLLVPVSGAAAVLRRRVSIVSSALCTASRAARG